MEKKLEQLLNSLIQKGWRPFNKDIREFFTLNEFTCGYRWEWTNHLGTIRAIVSKESWLWQFVCENGMIYSTPDDRWWPNYNWLENLFNCWWKHPDYWLMESALCDEYKLGDFLLNNIKVKWND